MRSKLKTLLVSSMGLWSVGWSSACDSGGGEAKPATAQGSTPAKDTPAKQAPAEAPPAGASASGGTATPAPAADVDPFAQGFCEYTIEGSPPNKGRGGLNNIQTTHWMTADQPGRSMAGKLLINCGADKQISIMWHNDTDDLPMAPGKHPIDKTGAKGTMSIIAAIGDLVEPGQLDITAWDASHIAGTFTMKIRHEGTPKTVTGKLDLRCPYGKTAACSP